jgi:glucokinase
VTEPRIGAIDIGATKVLVSLADRSGRLLTGATRRFETPADPAQLAAQAAALLSELAAGAPLLAAGCAVPGPLDREAATVVSFHNRGWRDVPLRDILTRALGVPVVLEDDATAAALGEAVLGAGAGRDPVAYLTVSSGIGAGLVIDGRPFRGAHGLAGEVGHIVLDEHGPPCGCGLHGDVEAYAGGHAIARLAAGAPGASTPEGVFAAAADGSPEAIAIVDGAQRAIARALAILIATFDPERIVVGGSIALAHPAWIDGAAAWARHLCHADSAAHADIVPALLGDASALTGAALIGARHAGVGS